MIHWYKLEAAPPADAVFSATNKTWQEMNARGERHYQMAELMTHYLASESGDNFPTAWRNYFQRAGIAGQSHEAAFQECFGMSADTFASRFKNWLKTL